MAAAGLALAAPAGWINASRPDATWPGIPERFFAAGEEKTILELPKGYGYPTGRRTTGSSTT